MSLRKEQIWHLHISYLQNKDQNSFDVQSLIMSIDLHGNGNNSFYSNLINMLNYYDISFNFNHDTLDDTKITCRSNEKEIYRLLETFPL